MPRPPDRRAAILVPRLARADAVGNDTRGLERALRELGFEVGVFAEEAEPGLEPGIEPQPIEAAEAFLATGQPLALYQLATQWERGFALLRRTRALRIVRDHNVTPARLLAPLGAEARRVQEASEAQRAALARDRRVALHLAASETNARELERLGARRRRIRVLPPFHPLEELRAAAPVALARPPGALVALFVGRIAPHKGHLRALRVAAVHAELFGEPLALRFVGSTDRTTAAWRRALEIEAARLGVAGWVEWRSEVSPAELRALYESADVFLCCSEHEGFCVPAVEAAELGLPVVATHLPALTDTLGPQALVLPPEATDDELAAAVHRLATDAPARDAIVRAQREHVRRRFSTTALSQTLAAALEGLARR